MGAAFIMGGLTMTSHSAIIADAAADYVAAAGSPTEAPAAAPAGWEYLYSGASTGGTEVALTASTVVGNGGNTGFGADFGFNLPAVLGTLTNTAAGAEYEIFADGFGGNGGTIPEGNGGVVGTDLLAHPGFTAGTDDFVISRFTIGAADIASFGNTATISGSFRNLVARDPVNNNTQGSIDVFVYLNSTLLFSVDQIDEAATGARLSQADGTFSEITTVEAGDTVSFVIGNNGNIGGDETALQAQIDVVPEPSTTLLGAFGLLALLRRRRA